MRNPFKARPEPDTSTRQTMDDDGLVLRDVGQSSQFQTQVTDFWNSTLTGFNNPRLIDNVWAANRSIQLCSQQIAAMPLRFFGAGSNPAWVANPDPNWFPNGIGDAVFAAVRSLYGWGDAFLYITSRYADGFPSGWTVLDPEPITVQNFNGRRVYRSQNVILPPQNVVQISRDPTGQLRGTSALRSYGSVMVSSIASSDVARAINDSGMPSAVLKSNRKITQEQAAALQAQWAQARTLTRGVPAVLPPEIDFQQLSFSPADLMLLDSQQFDARVIASAFGVPPFLLNMPMEGGLTYQNPAQLFDVWWRSELMPRAKQFADSLGAAMLPRGQWVKFDASDILAPDPKALADTWVAMLTAGVVTIDEFRAKVLNLPPQTPEESLDDLLVPPVAATSGINASDTVVPLRPTQEVSGV